MLRMLATLSSFRCKKNTVKSKKCYVLDTDKLPYIEDIVSRCETCALNAKQLQRTIITTSCTKTTVEKVGIDIFFQGGKQSSLLVDYFRTTKHDYVVIFSRHGIPTNVVTVNNSCTSSLALKEFCVNSGSSIIRR